MEFNIIYDFLYKFIQEEPFNIGGLLLFSLMTNIVQTNGISYTTGQIINSMSTKDFNSVYLFFKVFIAFSILFTILYSLYRHFKNVLATNLRQKLRHHLVKMVLLTNNDKYGSTNYNKLSSPINRISTVCFMLFDDFSTFLLPNIILLLVISVYLLYYNPIIGITFITGNIALFVYIYFIWDSVLKTNNLYQDATTGIESYLVDVLNNVDKIISRGQTEHEIKDYKERMEECITKSQRFYMDVNIHTTIMTVFIFAVIFFTIGYMITLFTKKQIELTTFITFFTIMLIYRDKMLHFIQQIPDFIEFVGRTNAVLTQFDNIKDDYHILINSEKKEYIDVPLEFNQITFKDVSYKYPNTDKFVFENWNFSFHTDNKIIGITGLSGNGKSTFAKLMLKMYPPNTGVIEIDGHNITDLDSNYIRKEITFVGQNGKLFDKTVIDNIFYGCSDRTKCSEYLTEILKYPKISELFKEFDIETKKAGSLGESLSGGQRQIVNIISGLINPSKLLILDEPTNALDPELKKELIHLIKDFKKYKKCVIIITHDRDIMSIFNDVIKV